MYIRCWGSRGSIPVSGKEYLKYGGDTTCMEIRSKKGDVIIVDAGTGIRSLGNKLISENIDTFHILFTHAHWDHLMGFPFFKPIFMRGTTMYIRSSSFNKKSIRDVFEGLMERPYFPVQLADKDIRSRISFRKIPNSSFKIGSITIRPVPLSHPKDGGFGFRFEEDGKSFVFLTDNELGHVHKGGLGFGGYLQFCRGADLLIHDAEYEDREYQKILKTSEEPWGHSVVSDVIELGLGAGVKKLGLFHINAMRTDTRMDEMVARARKIIAQKGSAMQCFGVGSSFSFTL